MEFVPTAPYTTSSTIPNHSPHVDPTRRRGLPARLRNRVPPRRLLPSRLSDSPPRKNDIYSFGVVVLELITGIEAFCPATGERMAVKATRNAVEMVDPRLRGGDEDMGEVGTMAALAAKCISETPGIRPSASKILTTMREAIPSLAFGFHKKLV
ncbi:hypothetical protein SASPL_150314 [Salvia splendens]|uniref:Protein kinase domain-containing protein n=1 Tax=Salvia splendens TaxID=180675 RepID=A0A8X8W6J4_SALSN|nr:hypothetical protein SASPL_150314 [Salvia splendens]